MTKSRPAAIGHPPDFMHCMVNLCMCASSPEDARNSNIRFVGCRMGLLLPSQGGTQQRQCLACKHVKVHPEAVVPCDYCRQQTLAQMAAISRRNRQLGNSKAAGWNTVQNLHVRLLGLPTATCACPTHLNQVQCMHKSWSDLCL